MQTYYLENKGQVSLVKRRNKGKYFRTTKLNPPKKSPVSNTLFHYEIKVYDTKPR